MAAPFPRFLKYSEKSLCHCLLMYGFIPKFVADLKTIRYEETSTFNGPRGNRIGLFR